MARDLTLPHHAARRWRSGRGLRTQYNGAPGERSTASGNAVDSPLGARLEWARSEGMRNADAALVATTLNAIERYAHVGTALSAIDTYARVGKAPNASERYAHVRTALNSIDRCAHLAMAPNPIDGNVGASLEPFLRVGWRFPGARALSSRSPVVLLYHGVPRASRGCEIGAEAFERHVAFVAEHFDIVSLRDVAETRGRTERIRVLLTFDDGFRSNAEVVAPILRARRVPAVFFVSSRHATPGRYLWFAYFEALRRSYPGDRFEFRGESLDMSPRARTRTVEELGRRVASLEPHPAAMYRAIDEELPRLDGFVSEEEIADRYAGMTSEQVCELASDPLFAVGTHAIDHPFLTRCAGAEMARQIDGNRRWIENATGRPCDIVAYPHGDYDGAVIEHCLRVGFEHGFAVDPRVRSCGRLERARIGVYSTSVDSLGFKIQWGNLMRLGRVPVG
jgi:peptidoglycan/xylan/chitin deacetylase (PgdA/CDA1 family)